MNTNNLIKKNPLHKYYNFINSYIYNIHKIYNKNKHNKSLFWIYRKTNWENYIEINDPIFFFPKTNLTYIRKLRKLIKLLKRKKRKLLKKPNDKWWDDIKHIKRNWKKKWHRNYLSFWEEPFNLGFKKKLYKKPIKKMIIKLNNKITKKIKLNYLDFYLLTLWGIYTINMRKIYKHIEYIPYLKKIKRSIRFLNCYEYLYIYWKKKCDKDFNNIELTYNTSYKNILKEYITLNQLIFGEKFWFYKKLEKDIRGIHMFIEWWTLDKYSFEPIVN